MVSATRVYKVKNARQRQRTTSDTRPRSCPSCLSCPSRPKNNKRPERRKRRKRRKRSRGHHLTAWQCKALGNDNADTRPHSGLSGLSCPSRPKITRDPRDEKDERDDSEVADNRKAVQSARQHQRGLTHDLLPILPILPKITHFTHKTHDQIAHGIVKGNYLPAEYKHDSFELHFDNSLNYTATGERVPFALLKERNLDAEAEEAQKLELIRSMREEGKTYQQIADELGYKSKSTIINICKKFKE